LTVPPRHFTEHQIIINTYMGVVAAQAAQRCVSALPLVNQPPGSKREAVSLGCFFCRKNRSRMPQDAPLVVGWAQDALVLLAAFGRRARGLPVWPRSASAIFFSA
jgi:hypothetical protein